MTGTDSSAPVTTGESSPTGSATTILYHCHDRSRGKDSERYLMLQRLFWDNDGWPYVKNGKSCAEGYVPEW